MNDKDKPGLGSGPADQTPSERPVAAKPVEINYTRKIVLSKDEATKQVQLLIDRYAIIPEDQDKKKEKVIRDMVNEVISYVMYGFMEVKFIDEQLKVVQYLKNLSTKTSIKDGKIIYDELEDSHQGASAPDENANHYGNTTHMMGMMCGGSADVKLYEVVTKLKSVDRKVMIGVGALFLCLQG